MSISQTPVSCTGSDDAGVGTAVWGTPTNANADDGSNAAVALNNSTSHYLKCVSYGVTFVPTQAVIVGIKVEVKQKSDVTGPVENSVRIFQSGWAGTDKSTGATLPTVIGYVVYGGPTDLWGLTWTAAQINAGANFGAGFSAKWLTANAKTVSVDFIRITVYYTLPAGAFDRLSAATQVFVNSGGAFVSQLGSYFLHAVWTGRGLPGVMQVRDDAVGTGAGGAPSQKQLGPGQMEPAIYWPVRVGSRRFQISVNNFYDEGAGFRPYIIVRANPIYGLGADLKITAAAGTGWQVLDSGIITIVANGVLRVDRVLPTKRESSVCWWDNIVRS